MKQSLRIVKLGFSADGISSVISSRAPSDYAVEDLYVLIFNADGSLNKKKYFTSDELTNNIDGSQPNPSGADNWVKLTATTGEAYIYGVANIGTGVPQQYEVNIKEFLEGVNTREEFLAYSATMTEDITRIGTTYVMAGAVNGGKIYTITEGVDIRTLNLRRLDSFITFKFTNTDNCEELVISSYQVCNVPKRTHLVELDATNTPGVECTWDAAKEEGDFYNTAVISDKVSIDNSFSFYMVENRKNAKESIPENKYGLREKQVKIPIDDATSRPTVENDAYVYAPDYGTYVIVKGKFKGKSTVTDNSGAVEADVRYTIHLGYVGNKANDFFSNRNTKYVYNVTVRGVDDIVVEVVEETETEKAPGAEGDVIFTDGTTKYKLDAHYETVLLKFNRDLLVKGAERANEFFTYKVNTPFTRLGASQENDNSWIRIVRNSKNRNGVYNTTFQKYPANDYLTIGQFINELKSIAQNDETTDAYDNNNEVVYTCHIDEFYYDNAPGGAQVNSSVPLWKYFVNDDEGRELQILNDVQLSPDGQSSITRSTYILSQRAIQTFYNPNPSVTELTSAYGVESVDETGPLHSWQKYDLKQYPTDKDTGRDNFLKMLTSFVNKSWDTYVNWNINGYTDMNSNEKPEVLAMKGDYQRAYLACLQRNRDTNGNGSLDKDEIKWYLPAINQYVGMFMGDAGLSDEAKLYTEQTYIFKHFISSSAINSNLIVYWGEESVSTSCGSEYGMSKTNEDGWVLNYYRCMRNLGGDSPQNYYKISTSNKTIEVPYLNEKAYRSKKENGELGRHFSWDEESKLYSGGFKYDTGTYNNGGGIKTHVESTLREAMPYLNSLSHNSACYDVRGNRIYGSYEWNRGTWRAPNLRELYLLSLVENLLGAQDVARTIFQFHDQKLPSAGSDENGYYRKGWYFNGSNLTMGYGSIEEGNSEGTHIRCIRDN